MFKDYYEVLDVAPNATAEQIRASFKQLALQSHPDRHVAPPHAEHSTLSHTQTSATRDFTEVQEAYEVLSDVARRYLYDLNYADLLAARQQLAAAAQEEQRRLWEQHARRERAEAERELREREKSRAAAAARAAADAGNLPKDSQDAFDMTRTVYRGGPVAADASATNTVDGSTLPKPRAPRYGRSVPTSSPPPHPEAAEARAAAAPAGSELADVEHSPQLPDRSHEQRDSPPLSSERRRHSRRQKQRQQRCGSSSSSAATSTSSTLPSIGPHRTVSLSFESTEPRGKAGTRRDGRPAAKDRDEAFYHQRAVEKTLKVFFADYGFHSSSVGGGGGAHQ